MKILFSLFFVFLSQNSSATSCAVDGNATDARVIARCGLPYQLMNAEAIGLAKSETELRLIEETNCRKNSNFTSCAAMNHYLKEIFPHHRDSQCRRDSTCITAYTGVRLNYEAYLAKRVPANVREVSQKFPRAYIDPLIAADELRVYKEMEKSSPELRDHSLGVFKERLCQKDRQKELGSEAVECEKFVEAIVSAN